MDDVQRSQCATLAGLMLLRGSKEGEMRVEHPSLLGRKDPVIDIKLRSIGVNATSAGTELARQYR